MNHTDISPDRSHPVVGWLWNLVDPQSSRRVTATPWSVMRDGEVWTLATSGFAAAVIRAGYGFPDAGEQQANFDYLFSKYPQRPGRALDVSAVMAAIPSASLLPRCSACDGTRRLMCETCGGACSIDCRCHCGDVHDRDCPDCRAVGSFPCKECTGEPIVDPVIMIGDSTFDAKVLASVVPHADPDTAVWQQDDAEHVAVIRSGPWELLLMPLRVFRGDRPTIDLGQSVFL